MAILESNSVESNSSSGYKKKINASSEDMIINNYQTILYKKPFASMVRESVSNALDSIREKHVAVSILSGQSKVEDHYVIKEGEMYKDSSFDHSYFDPQWLSKEDKVTLEYRVNPDTLGRDLFVLTDTGVGLGASRLQGFFEIGFSTKRLTSNELGGFGIGAKSPLATNIASYRMISNYNGKNFIFDIFTQKFECVHTKWGEDDTLNPYDIWIVDGVERRVYYSPTTEKNSVTIELEVKKHNRKLVEEAVTSQLMYFKEDIKFTIVDGSYRNDVNFKVPILFENDDVIIPDNRIFNRPHFVMKGVCYGLIDFKELELENKYGAIGIKVSMEEVEVVPSREEIVYGDKTRAAILLKYDRLVQTVTDMINKSIDVTDYLTWIRNCNNVLYAQSQVGDRALSVLANLVDKFSLDLRFPGDKSVKYVSEIDTLLGDFLKYENVQRTYLQKRGVSKVVVKKDKITSVGSILKNVYLQLDNTSNKTTSYILDTEGSFTVLRPNYPTKSLDALAARYCSGLIDYDTFLEEGKELISEEGLSRSEKPYLVMFIRSAKTLSLLLKSKELSRYDTLDIPDDYNKEEETSESMIDDVKEEYKELVRQRKKLGKFVVGTPASSSSGYKTTYPTFEVTPADLEEGVVVYGTKEDEKELTNLAKLYRNTPGNNSGRYYAFSDEFKIIRVAKGNLKYVDHLTHVSDYLLKIEQNTLVVDPFLKKLLTGYMVHKTIPDNMDYFTGMEPFDHSLKEIYSELCAVSHSVDLDHLTNCKDGEVIKNGYLYQLYELQNPNATPEELQEKATELLGEYVDEVDTVDLIDTEMYENIKRLFDFHRVYGEMLTHIGPMSYCYQGMSEELEADIKAFLRTKIDLLEYDYPNLNL